MNNKPAAWMMVNRENTSAYLTFDKPTRDMKISHEPHELYTHPAKTLDEQFEQGFKAGKEEGWKAHKFHHPAKTLTDEEIQEVAHGFGAIGWMGDTTYEFARAILRKAQEK